jgi:hypothetical protein
MSLRAFCRSVKLSASEALAAAMSRCAVMVGGQICGRPAERETATDDIPRCRCHARAALRDSAEYVYSDIEDDETEEIIHV